MRANLGCHPVVLSGNLHRHRSSSDIFRIIAEAAGFQDVRSQAEIIPHMLRAVGITVVGQVVARLCKDAGESALAYTVELAARAAVLAAALPALGQLLKYLGEIAAL